MQIQPITTYRFNTNYKVKTLNHSEKSADKVTQQPNFKGIKGFFKGGAVGAGATAAGVALIAGAAALPLFAAYIALNGAIAATAGHLIENQNRDKKA